MLSRYGSILLCHWHPQIIHYFHWIFEPLKKFCLMYMSLQVCKPNNLSKLISLILIFAIGVPSLKFPFNGAMMFCQVEIDLKMSGQDLIQTL